MELSTDQPGVIGIDVGTSGTKLAFFSFEGKEILSTTEFYPTNSPQPGWVEQYAEDWWEATLRGLHFFWEKGLKPNQVAAIGLSGQMENCLLLNHHGQPLHPVILYSDSRAIQEAAFINKQIGRKKVLQLVGNRIDQATTAAKLLWMKRNYPDIFRSAARLVSGAKDYIIFRFTGNYATDSTNASTTGLMNIHTLNWENSMLDCLGIDQSLLPPILLASEKVGVITKEAARESHLPTGCPVFCGLGDAGAAQLGSGAIDANHAQCYLGTTGWIALVKSEYQESLNKKLFVLNGPQFNQFIYIAPLLNAGRAFDWILKILFQEGERNYQEIENHLSLVPCGSNGLYFLPYLVGERCPYNDSNATGVFLGFTDRTTHFDMIRATLEGVTFNLRQALEMLAESSLLSEMTVIGGGSQSRVWVQMIADICGCKVSVPIGSAGIPGLGAAVAAMVGLKIIEDFSVVKKFLVKDYQSIPENNNKRRYELIYQFYQKIYPTLKPLFKKKLTKL